MTKTRGKHLVRLAGDGRYGEASEREAFESLRVEAIRTQRNALAAVDGKPITARPKITLPSASRIREMLRPRSQLRGSSPAHVRRRLVNRNWMNMAEAPVAVHEAGHAVIALDRGILPISVELSDSGGAAKHVRNLYGGEELSLMSLAGAIAQNQFCREIGLAVNCVPSAEDEASIHVSGDARRRLETIATTRVDALWFAIRAVARELLLARRLGSKRIIETCMPWNAFFADRSRF